MDDSFECSFFLVWPLPETVMGVLCVWLVGNTLREAHYVIRPFPLCEVKVLHPAQTIYNSTASRGDRKKKKKTNKQMAPLLSILRSERRVIQRRRQPTPT